MKTLNEISNQGFRLYYEALERGNNERASKIIRIRQRYNANINNQPEQQKLLGCRGDWMRKKQAEERRRNIKYPHAVYMGQTK